jgi:charged multivesicular body protein 2A
VIEWAFGKRMTPAERLRKHQRALEKTQRELDRERVKLENQEKKLVQDIKKSAKNGQIGACKIQAKVWPTDADVSDTLASSTR